MVDIMNRLRVKCVKCGKEWHKNSVIPWGPDDISSSLCDPCFGEVISPIIHKRQIGEGNLNFIVVLISFIPGMAFVVYILNPLLEKQYNVQKLLLTDIFGSSAGPITGILVMGAGIWFITVSRKRVKK